jgi:hypothetical protein
MAPGTPAFSWMGRRGIKLRSQAPWNWTYGRTPEGYIFPEGTDMFWFLPAEDLAQYLKQNPGAAAVSTAN